MLISRLLSAVGLLCVFTSSIAAVGRTPGEFSVDEEGAAEYTIPIKLPAGPKGLQPNLAIKYDSQSGDGTMGPGWYLSGLGSITRCDKTYAQDSAAAAVSLVTTDGYCLNDSRMRLVSGSYGTAASTYQTELADFTKITAYGSAGNGPGYFIVQRKDGRIYEYGNSNDGSTYNARITASGTSTPYQWRLNKVRDRAGNNYVVTYGTGQSGSVGVGVPLSISYVPSSAGSTSYDYSISFAYGVDTAAGTQSGYVAGGSTVNNNRLTGITVQRGVTVIHRYNFGYELATVTNRYRLNLVTECPGTAVDTTCLSPTTITYQNGAAGVSAANNTALSSTTSVKGAYDFNGDGRQDILYVSGTTLYVTFAYAGGFGTPVGTGITLASGDLYEAGDLVASGKEDILVSQGGYWYRYYWNGSSFSGISTGIAKDTTDGNSLVLADINGDGLPDVMTGTSPGQNGLTIYGRTNTASNGAFSLSSRSVTYNRPMNCQGFRWTGNSFTYYSSLKSAVKAIDINGDGRQDLVEIAGWIEVSGNCIPNGGSNGAIAVALISNGSTFAQGTVLSNTSASMPVSIINWNDDECSDIVYGNSIYSSACNGNIGQTAAYTGTFLGAMDWNGDGRTDLLVNSGGYVGIYLSTGTGLSALTTTSIPVPATALIFDQNGDGLDDLGSIGTSSPYAVTYRLHEGIGTPPDLVASITDGYGVSYSPTYVSIAQSSIYSKGSGAALPVKDIQDARYVVSQVSISDGVGGTYAQSYTYAGARQDIQGRGFMGFQSITVADSRVDAPKVKTYYKTAFPYGGMVYQRDVSQNNGTTLISRTVNTPSVINLDTTAYNQRYFPYIWSSTTDNYEVGGVKNSQWITSGTTSFSYDSYGNVTSRTSVVTDKDGTAPQSPTYNQTWTQVTTNTFTPDTGNWCVGLPTQTTEQYYATGALSVTRTASFTPDYVNCRVTQQVIEPSSSIYKVTADYGYDAFGNISSIAITGKKPNGTDMEVRTTTINWDATGQFPISATNPEGHITQAGYSYNLGVQINQTDPNGLVTAWTYDNFGRKLTETRPDGTATTWSYNDCASVSGGCQNGDPFSGSTSINKMVVIATDKDSGGAAIQDSWTYLDQLERTLVTKSRTLSGGYSRVGAQYNALGQLYRQTAPCDADSCAVYWTTRVYDGLGRVTATSRPISATNSTLQTTSLTYQGMTTATTDPLGKSSTKAVDPNGLMRRSMDHDGYYQNFTYDAFGSLKTVIDSSANALFSANYAYGLRAFKIQTSDIDRGIWNYTVNSLGEVTELLEPTGLTQWFEYDRISRPTHAMGVGFTVWTWGFSAANRNIGKLQTVEHGYNSWISQTYTYDGIGRLRQKEISNDVGIFRFNYLYNGQGMLDTLQYPTSTAGYRLTLKHLYQNGQLQQVKDNAAGTVFWQADANNTLGQVTQETLGNGIVTSRNYDAITGRLNSIQSGVGGGTGVQNESYLWDAVGNLIQRQNNTLGLTESFYYDNLYRLDYSQLNGVTNLDLTYDAMGNITYRSDVGGYDYTTTQNGCNYYSHSQRHAVRKAGGVVYCYDASGTMQLRGSQEIFVDDNKRPITINDGARSLKLDYDAFGQRSFQEYYDGTSYEQTYYAEELLEQVYNGSTTEWRHYIYGGGRVPVAIMSRSSTGTNTTRYVLEDHQDSVAKILDSSGNVTLSESFTAYGDRRNPSTWSGSPSSGDLNTIAGITRQGYTWQTALGNMGLNHMNGRVQDAITGRFISADPYITDPTNTQNYNRYSYVYNNPLSYIDPSGFQVCPEVDEDSCLEEIVVPGTREEPDDPCRYGCGDYYGYPGGPGEGEGGDGGSDSSTPSAPLEEIVVAATRETQQEEISIDWIQAANDWWPGFQIGTCLYGGCDIGTWAMGILGAIPGVAAEVKGAKVATTIFKSTHYAERLAAKGVNVVRAEGAVAERVAEMRSSMTVGAEVEGRFVVDGVQVEYSAYMLPDGTVNVGTIFPVK